MEYFITNTVRTSNPTSSLYFIASYYFCLIPVPGKYFISEMWVCVNFRGRLTQLDSIGYVLIRLWLYASITYALLQTGKQTPACVHERKVPERGKCEAFLITQQNKAGCIYSFGV
jgi:hypothetical protein